MPRISPRISTCHEVCNRNHYVKSEQPTSEQLVTRRPPFGSPVLGVDKADAENGIRDLLTNEDLAIRLNTFLRMTRLSSIASLWLVRIIRQTFENELEISKLGRLVWDKNGRRVTYGPRIEGSDEGEEVGYDNVVTDASDVDDAPDVVDGAPEPEVVDAPGVVDDADDIPDDGISIYACDTSSQQSK